MLEKNRVEVSDEYKWDINKIIKDDKEFLKKYDLILNYAQELACYKGKILTDENTLYEFLKKYDELNIEFSKLYVWACMQCDTDTANSDYQDIKMKSIKLNEIISETLSFVIPEIVNDDYQRVLELIAKNENLDEYKFYLEKMFDYKKHTLSFVEEALLAKMLKALGIPNDIQYNILNSDIDLGFVTDKDNQKLELTASTYYKYMNSADRVLRENAFKGMYSYYKKFKNTIAATYKGQVKEDNCLSNIRAYNSALEASLFDDRIKVEVYDNLITKVHKNLDKMYNYLALRKDILDLQDMHMYDIYVNICKKDDKEIDFKEAKQIVLEALRPLGNEYLDVIHEGMNDKWIDVYPNKNKKSGAYSFGSYQTNPYILLNYDNTIESVSTLIHELGHSVHSYYSRNNQPYIYHDYPIVLAEIASTVNEILLNEYLYNSALNDDERKFYLVEFLEKVRGTIYRQTMFAEFEKIVHEKEDENISLTENFLSDTYYNLNKLYYGDNVISDELIRYEWMRIPHFYHSFYVYKYATGLAIAIKIANDILENKNNMKEKYLHFLKSGSSKHPLDLLKEIGIDLEDGYVIDEALRLFETKLNELKELIKK